MKGGAIFRTITNSLNDTQENALKNMCEAQGTTIELLSYTSLFSFVYRITVKPEYSRFYIPFCKGPFINEKKPIKTQGIPVTNYVLKISLIDDSQNTFFFSFDDGQKIIENEKATVTGEAFEIEALVQQQVWKDSLETSYIPICPGIGSQNAKLNQKSSNSIWDLINSKIGGQPLLCSVLEMQKQGKKRAAEIYPLNSIQNNINSILRDFQSITIGYILMSEVAESNTYDSYLKTVQNNRMLTTASPEIYKLFMAYASSIAQIISLFAYTNLIHLDLHSNNNLIYRKDYPIPEAKKMQYGADITEVWTFLTLGKLPFQNPFIELKDMNSSLIDFGQFYSTVSNPSYMLKPYEKKEEPIYKEVSNTHNQFVHPTDTIPDGTAPLSWHFSHSEYISNPRKSEFIGYLINNNLNNDQKIQIISQYLGYIHSLELIKTPKRFDEHLKREYKVLNIKFLTDDIASIIIKLFGEANKQGILNGLYLLAFAILKRNYKPPPPPPQVQAIEQSSWDCVIPSFLRGKKGGNKKTKKHRKHKKTNKRRGKTNKYRKLNYK